MNLTFSRSTRSRICAFVSRVFDGVCLATCPPVILANFSRESSVSVDFDMPLAGRRLGVSVEELTSQLAGYFGAKDGVLVTSVADGSAASRAGLKAGDVITAINGQAVRSREDLLRGLREAPDSDEVTIGIVRDKKDSTVKAKLEAPRRTSRGRPV